MVLCLIDRDGADVTLHPTGSRFSAHAVPLCTAPFSCLPCRLFDVSCPLMCQSGWELEEGENGEFRVVKKMAKSARRSPSSLLNSSGGVSL